MAEIPTLEPSRPRRTAGNLKKTRYANVLVNPVAGGRKCKKHYRAVIDMLRDAGLKCDVTISRYPGELTELAGELAIRGSEMVVVCGGDGTINEVINGIAGTETALGIVPLGAANDFGTNLGLNHDMAHACAVIKEGQTRRIDLVRVNQDRFFCGTACLGFDAQVAAFARRRKIDPFVMHALAGLLKFFSFQPKRVDLRFDGQKYFGDVFLVAFGNTRSYARRMLLTPDAECDDALLDVCVVKPMPKRKILSIFPSFYKGGHVNREGIVQYRTGTVFAQSMGPMDLYADGDFLSRTPVRMEVIPKHLKVIVGARPT